MLKILALIVSLPAMAAQPSGPPSVTMSASGLNSASMTVVPGQLVSQCGGSGSSGCFSLYIGASISGASNYAPFYKAGVIYQVPTGKTTYCFDITGSSSQTLGGTGPANMELVSATATFATNASSITGGVYQCGAAGAACSSIGTSSVAAIVPGTYSFGSLTWPGIQGFNYPFFYQIHMDCFEQ